MDKDPHPRESPKEGLVINEFGIMYYKGKVVSFFANEKDYQIKQARWHQEFEKEVLPPFPAKFFVLVIAGGKEYFLDVENGSIFYEQSLKDIQII